MARTIVEASANVNWIGDRCDRMFRLSKNSHCFEPRLVDGGQTLEKSAVFQSFGAHAGGKNLMTKRLQERV
jgi:hypothetical protein